MATGKKASDLSIPTKFAIIGAGKMALTRGRAILEAGHQIVFILSKDGKNAEKLAKQLNASFSGKWHDREEILQKSQKIDAVVTAVPRSVQTECVKWALDQEIPVLVGGPLAPNVEEALMINQLAQSKKCLVEAGYEKRYSPLHQKVYEILHGQTKEEALILKDKIQKGQLGHILGVQSDMEFSPTPGSWYLSQHLSGGMPVTHGSYDHALIRDFLNDGPPKFIFATGNKKNAEDADSVLDTCMGTIVYSSLSVQTRASYQLSNGKEPRYIKVYGTEGMLLIKHNTDKPGGELLFYPKEGGLQEIPVSDENPFTLQIQAFVRAISTSDRRYLLNPAEDAAIEIQIAKAIEQSALKNGERYSLNMSAKENNLFPSPGATDFFATSITAIKESSLDKTAVPPTVAGDPLPTP